MKPAFLKNEIQFSHELIPAGTPIETMPSAWGGCDGNTGCVALIPTKRGVVRWKIRFDEIVYYANTH